MFGESCWNVENLKRAEVKTLKNKKDCMDWCKGLIEERKDFKVKSVLYRDWIGCTLFQLCFLFLSDVFNISSLPLLFFPCLLNNVAFLTGKSWAYIYVCKSVQFWCVCIVSMDAKYETNIAQVLSNSIYIAPLLSFSLIF